MIRNLVVCVALPAIAAAQDDRWIEVTDAAAPVAGMSVVHVAPAARVPQTAPVLPPYQQLPGWPVTIAANASFAPWRTGVVTDLDRDGRNEILVASTNQRLYGFRPDGTALPGFPIVLIGMAQYAPSVADLEGDGDLEIVLFTRGQTAGGRLYAFDHTGAVLPGFPRSVNNNNLEGSPTLADLDDDGELEILVPERAWPIGYLHVFERDGSEWGGAWPVALDHVPTGSPAVADVDGDGRLEIAYYSYNSLYLLRWDGTVLPGWPQGVANANFSYQSPAIANLDADPGLEIVAGAHGNAPGYRVFDTGGALLPGWPRLVGTWTYVPPTVADLDGDGTLEILGGREGTGVSPSGVVYAWNATGTTRPGFPYQSFNPGFAGGCGGSLSVADVDGDGAREILADANVMNANQGFLYGVTPSGAAAAGFPLRVDGFTYMNGPVVTDVDGDGDLELLFLSHNGATVKINLFEMPAAWSPARIPWGAYHQDVDRSGWIDGGNRLHTHGEFLLGATVDVRIVGRPGALATVGLSTQNVHTDTAFGWYHLGAQRRILNSAVIPASGEAVRLYTLPSNPIFIGTRLLLQGAVLQGGTGAVTNLLGRVIH